MTSNPTNEHREQARADRVVITGRVVNINTHGEPTRARLREIEASVGNGYEREYRELGWSKALQSQLRDLHFLLTFFSDSDDGEKGEQRDAEIREVLEGLATYRNPICWCPPNTEAEPHTEVCRATTVLYAKLQPAQINGASSTPKG